MKSLGNLPKNQGNPLVGVAYMRVSTEQQHLGIPAQKQQIEQWARSKKVVVAAFHEDPDMSGATPLEKRVVLHAAIRDLRTLNAGLLIFAKRDRIARSVETVIAIERAVAKSGAMIVTADGLDASNEPSARLMRGIFDQFSEFERSLIAGRTRAALDVKRRRGERIGTVPYGMRLGADGKQLEPDAKEANVIAQIVELHRRGTSLRSIAFALTEAGYRTRRGGCYDHKRVSDILERHAGYVPSSRPPRA